MRQYVFAHGLRCEVGFPEKAREDLARLEVHEGHEGGAVVQKEENGGERGGQEREDGGGEGEVLGGTHGIVDECQDENVREGEVDEERRGVESEEFGEEGGAGEVEEVAEVQKEGESAHSAVVEVVNGFGKGKDETRVRCEGG